MKDLYEIRMSLIVTQESLYEMKYSFGKLRNFYTDFTAVFILRVNIRFLVGYIRYWMLHSNATLYRGLTCLKQEDQWSCKRSPDILSKKSTKHTKPGKYMVKK